MVLSAKGHILVLPPTDKERRRGCAASSRHPGIPPASPLGSSRAAPETANAWCHTTATAYATTPLRMATRRTRAGLCPLSIRSPLLMATSNMLPPAVHRDGVARSGPGPVCCSKVPRFSSKLNVLTTGAWAMKPPSLAPGSFMVDTRSLACGPYIIVDVGS